MELYTYGVGRMRTSNLNPWCWMAWLDSAASTLARLMLCCWSPPLGCVVSPPLPSSVKLSKGERRTSKAIYLTFQTDGERKKKKVEGEGTMGKYGRARSVLVSFRSGLIFALGRGV